MAQVCARAISMQRLVIGRRTTAHCAWRVGTATSVAHCVLEQTRVYSAGTALAATVTVAMECVSATLASQSTIQLATASAQSALTVTSVPTALRVQAVMASHAAATASATMGSKALASARAVLGTAAQTVR